MAKKSSNEVRGFEAVRQALRYESFPAAKSELYYSIGDIEVEDGHGSFTPAREVLDNIGDMSFTTAEDLLAQMRSALRMRRRAA